MQRLLALSIALVILMPVGCASARGHVYVAAGWPSDSTDLGRIAIVGPTVSPRVSSSKEEEIKRIARETLAHLPGATLVENHELLERLGPDSDTGPISDYEAVTAARELDLDTVCLLTVGHYQGVLSISLLPPMWSTRTTVLYSIRLIDVQSGRALLHAVRLRTGGGHFAILTSRDLADDFRNDLEALLMGAQT
ncbi:MAG: hypothetical protein O7H41_08060 [Planctomycetota bacterium]|nr:hypothetical protein [Planctomycetota bacterium]